MGSDHNAARDASGIAHNTGFSQCVFALRRTLATTPLGWALVAWLAWDAVPHERIGLWLGGFAGCWLVGLAVLQHIVRAGPQVLQHSRQLLAVALLDGAGWALMVWLLMGHDQVLDSWLSAVLCGVSAVNAPVYITYIRAYYVLIGAMWSMTLVGLLTHPGYAAAPRIAVGLTVFFVLIVYYMRAIAHRVLEGIQLQLTNTSLTEQLRQALQVVEHDASTDALTGLPNRRALDAVLGQQMELAKVRGFPFALLMLDIDFFKPINDTYGHDVGDDALRAFAFRVRDFLRQGDVFARYGGEEFVAVLPRTAMETALEVAERLRAGVQATDLLTNPPIHITVSIGVTVYRDGLSADDIIKHADLAVYAAKAGGRNRICSSAD